MKKRKYKTNIRFQGKIYREFREITVGKCTGCYFNDVVKSQCSINAIEFDDSPFDCGQQHPGIIYKEKSLKKLLKKL